MKHSCVSLEIERALWLQGIEHIAGVDEAGRGPLAGPVVAAAVVFPRDLTIEHVDDSKKCTAKQREALFTLIMEQAICVGVGVVDHEVIDRINILQATILAMRKSIESMNIQPEYAIIDGNSFKHETLKFQNIIRGDETSFTIAAASIVAKVTRDRLMRDLDIQFPQYGFAQHKGYGTRQHIDAIRTYGFCEIHRRSFHPSALQGKLL
ncbi:MAG: ribonuclease HII [Ignavibacteriales bacterium]|nr:ribonuclease HII [Ignavibacteriales bacterium]